MVHRQQLADRAGRPPMKSPGSPPLQRETQRLLWIEIAKGLIPAQAAFAVGASQPVGQLECVKFFGHLVGDFCYAAVAAWWNSVSASAGVR